MGYTFLSNIKISMEKTQEKYYFCNLNSLGPLPPSHPTFKHGSPTIGFPAVVDAQWDTFS